MEEFEAELKYLGKDKSRSIVRFHTDVDKSFLGKVKKLAVKKGWKQTDTGGYRSRANGIVERRIGMLKQTARTVLLAATGATYYYDQLWGHGMQYANYCLNRNNWSDTVAPFTQRTGAPYRWCKEDHSSGELVIYHVPPENRAGPYQQADELGIWMRRAGSSAHSAVVVTNKWGKEHQAWVLGQTIVANSFKVYSGIHPLRMCPREGTPEEEFDKWIDRAFDPLLHHSAQKEGARGEVNQEVPGSTVEGAGYETPELVSDDEDSGEDEQPEYTVEKVLNKKTVKGKKFYLVKWEGYSRAKATWEPESNLVGCGDAVQEYEDTLRAAVVRPMLLQQLDTCAMFASGSFYSTY